MSDGREGPLVVGALTAVMGAVLFLAAGDVLPAPDRMFVAPRWLVALFGLGFFFGGAYAISLALATPWMRSRLGAVAGLTFVNASALLLTWLALTVGNFEPLSGSIGAGSFLLRRDALRIIAHAFLWMFAFLADATALVPWVVALRALVRRHSA